MAVVARYERVGERWVPVKALRRPPVPPAEEDTPFTIDHDRKTGYWAIREKDGALVTLCVDRKGAERIVKRFRAVGQPWKRQRKRATLFKTTQGWCLEVLVGYCPETGNLYPLKFYHATREGAEAHLA